MPLVSTDSGGVDPACTSSPFRSYRRTVSTARVVLVQGELNRLISVDMAGFTEAALGFGGEGCDLRRRRRAEATSSPGVASTPAVAAAPPTTPASRVKCRLGVCATLLFPKRRDEAGYRRSRRTSSCSSGLSLTSLATPSSRIGARRKQPLSASGRRARRAVAILIKNLYLASNVSLRRGVSRARHRDLSVSLLTPAREKLRPSRRATWSTVTRHGGRVREHPCFRTDDYRGGFQTAKRAN